MENEIITETSNKKKFFKKRTDNLAPTNKMVQIYLFIY
jgi:hypothetical protein